MRGTGKCLMCGAKVDGNALYCKDCKLIRHRQANKKHYVKMVREGYCVWCGRETNGLIYCAKCKEKVSKRNSQAKPQRKKTDKDVLSKAIKTLKEEYKKAKGSDFVFNPVGYALYHTWKKYDEEYERKTGQMA